MIIDSNIQIPFHPVDLDDMWWYKAREKEDDVQACDSIFGSIFLWSKAYCCLFRPSFVALPFCGCCFRL